ncbi:uncharacterized protein LOC114667257 isoform X2 [Erpetoichthys calabaricus]|uniref:uncharacterized protein LOC114667257 isoform X2 n=1 Tax=Erpetoichthys calabaricus TaxID=27687 RepID=UPI00223498C9|nr:uncharacterized protein LOC114667257 isoform X2 [Erpetoichthys calabaricus]
MLFGWPAMSNYNLEGHLHERSSPVHIKVESPGMDQDAFGDSSHGTVGAFVKGEDTEVGSTIGRGALPFNVVVVHPSVVEPGYILETRAAPSHLEQNHIGNDGSGKRKSRFSGAELEVLVSEVTRFEAELFSQNGRLRRRERERIWAGIQEKVNAVSRVRRTLREVKKRWDDLKRRSGGRLDLRQRRCCPSGRMSSQLGRTGQTRSRLDAFHCTADLEMTASSRLRSSADTDVLDEDGNAEVKPGPSSILMDHWVSPNSSYLPNMLVSFPEARSPLPNGTTTPSSPEHHSLQFVEAGMPGFDPKVLLNKDNIMSSSSDFSEMSQTLQDALSHVASAASNLGDRVEVALTSFKQSFSCISERLIASHEAMVQSLKQNNFLLHKLLEMLERQTATTSCQATSLPPDALHATSQQNSLHETMYTVQSSCTNLESCTQLPKDERVQKKRVVRTPKKGRRKRRCLV